MVKAAGSIIRYPGGKFRARKMLEKYVPETATTILSPFFGGGTFELHLAASGKKVVAYDGFLALANFWEVLLTKPVELAAVTEVYLGAVNQAAFKALQQELRSVNEESQVAGRELDLAAKFFVVNRCSFSGTTLSGGFSNESATTRFTTSSVQKLQSFSEPNLRFHYGLFEKSLDNIPSAVDFLFLDPPYLLDGTKNSLYGIGGDLHKTFNHALLKETVVNTGLPFLLTYNNSPVIRELWKDYEIFDAEWSYGMNSSKKSSEIVIVGN